MLPLRFAARPSDASEGAPIVMLDGSFGAAPDRGLHLAHWPGNRTPGELRADLSTEIAFRFLDLAPREQAELLDGAEAICVNHYDTDGLCAAFVLLHPEKARAHRELLVEAAAAGDFHEVRSELGLALDASLRRFGDEFQGEDRLERFEAGVRFLGELLDDPDLARERAREDLDAFEADQRDLAAALFDDLIYLDLGVWTSALDATSRRSPKAAAFDPGRHAFFASGRADRALLLGQRQGGTTARFVLGTYSFFDVVSRQGSPRPDLAALAAKLNALEQAAGGSGSPEAWRHQDPRGATPELWFGAPDLPLYAEHADAYLGQSQLTPETIKLACIDAVRDVWPLPDDDDEADDDEDIFAV